MDQCAHYPSKHIPNLNLNCCEVVYTLLHTSVHLPSSFFEVLVTEYWQLPTFAKKPASCDTSAMVFAVFRSLTFGPAKRLDLFGVSGS